jgi:type IV pilus assembly protein PilE
MNRLSNSMAARSKPRAAGFTLIELMVTLAIATVLLTIAVPSYQTQVRKSRRTDARTALLDLATREERYYAVNNSYSQAAPDLAYADSVNGTNTGQIRNFNIGAGYYTVTVTAPAGAAPATFTIQATATGTQLKDKQCAMFTIDYKGNQTSADANAAPTTGCWN